MKYIRFVCIRSKATSNKYFVLQIGFNRSSWPSKERKRSRMRLKKEAPALGDWGKGEKFVRNLFRVQLICVFLLSLNL